MNVVGAQSGGVEGVLAQYLSVGGDDEDVASGELVADLGDTGWLPQGEVTGAGELGDGSRGSFAAAALARVGLGDHQANLVW